MTRKITESDLAKDHGAPRHRESGEGRAELEDGEGDDQHADHRLDRHDRMRGCAQAMGRNNGKVGEQRQQAGAGDRRRS